MDIQQLLFSISLFIGFGVTNLLAQEVCNSAGGTASGSGGVITYSVGQVTYNTISNAKMVVIQGVQQPVLVLPQTGMNEKNGRFININAYPNPTTSYIVLDVGDNDLDILNYQIIDVSGKILLESQINEKATLINIIDFHSSELFLNIYKNKKIIKVIKIIKN